MSTSSKDLQGRPYVKVSQIKIGVTLQVDGDFTCLKKGAKRKVFNKNPDDKSSFYIRCSAGYHYLDGQLKEDENGEAYLLGLYLVSDRGPPGTGII